MSGPNWVMIGGVVIVHDRQISRHGGSPGMRDRTLLEAGCARPLNRHAYGVTDLYELAAAYAFGIAKAHAFVDGNKRTAFVTAVGFLRINGIAFSAGQSDIVTRMEDLASDALTETAFADWLRAGATPL